MLILSKIFSPVDGGGGGGGGAGGGGGGGGTEADILAALEEPPEEVAWKYIPLSGPAVDPVHSTNVTAQLGSTAVLNCRVKYIGGKVVSTEGRGCLEED